MHELDDQTLLRHYAEHDSEPAFAAIVARHVDKVYSAALRQTRNDHAAEEITQAVFVILARQAKSLRKHTALSGWLYETTRLTALTHIRSEIRRAHREQEAHMQTALNETESNAWPHIAPLLDDAMDKLSAADRHAIVLRYFDGKSLGEVGAAMGASEDAAKKRVARAVEKLRGWFIKRGVTLTATVLTAAISANSVQAAPLGLAPTVTATAAKGAAVSGSTLTLIKGALKVMAWTKMKVAAVVGVGAVLVGTSVYQAEQVAKLREQNKTLQQAQAPLAAQIQQLQSNLADATNRLAGLLEDNSRLKSRSNQQELLKLRGEKTRLQNDSSELARVRSGQQNLRKMMMADAKKAQLRSASTKAALLSDMLALDSTQATRVKEILAGNVDALLQLTEDVLTGKQQKAETIRKLEEIRTGQEVNIQALLTPGQQAAYKNWQNEQAENTVMVFAQQEVEAMKKYLDLSSEQSEAVVTTLSSLPARLDDGGTLVIETGQAEAELEARVQALAQVLTPKQLQTYRAQEQNKIENRKSAIEEFKTVLKTTM